MFHSNYILLPYNDKFRKQKLLSIDNFKSKKKKFKTKMLP